MAREVEGTIEENHDFMVSREIVESLMSILHAARKEFPTQKTYSASQSLEVGDQVRVSYSLSISHEGLR